MKIHRLFRYALLTAGGLVLVVAVLLIGAISPMGRQILLNLALARSQSVLAAQLSIGRLGGTLFTNSRLEDVTLRLDGEPVITASAIEVDYSIRDLIAKRFRITRLTLIEPRIVLARSPEGWNVSRLLRKRPTGEPTPFKIERFEIRDGTLTMVNGPSDVGGVRVPTTFDHLDTIFLLERSAAETTLNIASLSLQGHSPALTVKSLSGRIISRERDLIFQTVHLETAQSSLVLDGRVDYPDTEETS